MSSTANAAGSLRGVVAVWFGRSLMGAAALNGVSKDVSDPYQRVQIAAPGWSWWSPVRGGSHRGTPDRRGGPCAGADVGANTGLKTAQRPRHGHYRLQRALGAKLSRALSNRERPENP